MVQPHGSIPLRINRAMSKNYFLVRILTNKYSSTIIACSLPSGMGEGMRYRRNHHRSRLPVLVLISAVLGVPGTTYAQDSGSALVLEEVIVTARKREERLIDIPMSAMAMTAEEINARGISNLIDAQYSVPGLTISEFAPGQQRLVLRGIGPSGGGTVGSATVGLYLDEMPINIGSFDALDVRLLDMERVEVLRGPQPTLYGESSMGGAIRYVSANPDLTEFSGSVKTRVGTLTDGNEPYRLSGVVSVPLIQNTLGIRIAAAYEESGGWIDYEPTGQDDVNSSELRTIRAKVLWEPNDEFSASFMYLHNKVDSDFANFSEPDTRKSGLSAPSHNAFEYDLINAVASYDFGPATLLASLGYMDRSIERGGDAAALVGLYEFVLGIVPPGTLTGAGVFFDEEFEMTTQEVRLSSNENEKFNWLLGFYRRDPENPGVSGSFTVPANVAPFDPLRQEFNRKSDAFAVFGEIRYQVTDQIEIGLGGRYFEDDKKVISLLNGAPAGPSKKGKFDTFNPRVDVSYTTAGGNLYYFNAAKGYRSGGFNSAQLPPGFPPLPEDYGPDKVWSYEIGTKQVLLDGRLRFEAAVYYSDWSNVQSPDPRFSPFGVVTGAGDISGPGVDLTLSALLSETLMASLTYGYIGMEYDKDIATHKKGDPVDLTSENSVSFSFDYSRETSLFDGSTVNARADFQYSEGYVISFKPIGVYETGSRTLLSLRAGLQFNNLEVYVYADNVTDDKGVIYPRVPGFLNEPIIGRPRTVGVGVDFNF